MKDKAEEIVKALAEWSKKYPRGITYPASNKKMDSELIDIEERAKSFIAIESKDGGEMNKIKPTKAEGCQ